MLRLLMLLLIGSTTSMAAEIPEQLRGVYTSTISKPGSCTRATVIDPKLSDISTFETDLAD
jgi:hypothetical protein